jgi:hypothetical protein
LEVTKKPTDFAVCNFVLRQNEVIGRATDYRGISFRADAETFAINTRVEADLKAAHTAADPFLPILAGLR